MNSAMRIEHMFSGHGGALSGGIAWPGHICGVCDRVLSEDDFPVMEYVKTKSGSENFYHHDCVLTAWK